MSKITEFGYIGISVSDAAAWKKYATEIVGMELVDDGEPDRFYLRMDAWHHRIVVHIDGTDDLKYLGWRVANAGDLSFMAAKLEAAKIPFTVGSPADCKERRVLGVLQL